MQHSKPSFETTVTQEFFNYKLLEERITHLSELMKEHDKSTETAINKAENSVNQRLGTMNEFREQQKDIIQTFARAKEVDEAIKTIDARFEQNILTVTARSDAAAKALDAKLEILSGHFSEKIELVKKTIDDKRETLYAGILQRFDDLKNMFEEKLNAGLKNIDDKVTANLRVEQQRFAATDAQMETKINSNADVSNTGINSLNQWRQEQQGSLKVIYAIGGVVTTIVVALIIAYLRTVFK